MQIISNSHPLRRIRAFFRVRVAALLADYDAADEKWFAELAAINADLKEGRP